jgi:LAGLIDADG DNA endonuclease family
MDDGSRNAAKGIPQYNFSTHGFSFNDVEVLKKVLTQNFQLTSVIWSDKRKPRLYIKPESKPRFRELVGPFILPCFHYKL